MNQYRKQSAFNYIPSGMFRLVDINHDIFPLHPVRDASQMGCIFGKIRISFYRAIHP